jgi:hypothetical protein
MMQSGSAAQRRRQSACDSLPEALHGLQYRSVRQLAAGDLNDRVASAATSLIEPRIEALIKASGIDFRIGGKRAYYTSFARLRAGAAAAGVSSSPSTGTGPPSTSSVTASGHALTAQSETCQRFLRLAQVRASRNWSPR